MNLSREIKLIFKININTIYTLEDLFLNRNFLFMYYKRMLIFFMQWSCQSFHSENDIFEIYTYICISEKIGRDANQRLLK